MTESELNAKAFRLARETFHLNSKQAWHDIFYGLINAGVPGATANQLRQLAWAHRAELRAASRQKPPRQPRQKKAAQPEPAAAPVPDVIPEPEPQPEAIPVMREYDTDVPPVREGAASQSYAADLGVAPATPAKPGRCAIGPGQPGQTWGLLGMSTVFKNFSGQRW